MEKGKGLKGVGKYVRQGVGCKKTCSLIPISSLCGRKEASRFKPLASSV